jgi:neutral ceramidase
MHRRVLCIAALALLVLLACASLPAVAAASSKRHHTHGGAGVAPLKPRPSTTPKPHQRVRHYQGETLAKPESMLHGLHSERFIDEAKLAAALDSHLLQQQPLLKQQLGAGAGPGQFEVGAGSADVTGQVAEIGFMGYAVPDQKGDGLQMRLRARAFVIVDANPASQGKRVAYVSVDLCMGFQMVKIAVIEMLQGKFGPDMYTHANVLISGTHTHASPGGLGGTVLVDITTFGFIKENFDAAVKGIFNAIVKAHNSVEPASIKLAVGQCDRCNINRSPSAYLLDPEAERAAYPNNTDHAMTVLRIEGTTTGREIGMINFFAVHGTSLNNTYNLVSGDNKGYAGLKFEEMKNGPSVLPGQGTFVAAFGQSNLGDVSPNTRGPRCPDGSPCDFNTSTCGGFTQGCIATGPGLNQVDSQRIIGQMQMEAVRKRTRSIHCMLMRRFLFS